MPSRPGAWGVSAIPTESVALFVGMALEMVGVMALELSHPNAASRKAFVNAWDGAAARVARVA